MRHRLMVIFLFFVAVGIIFAFSAMAQQVQQAQQAQAVQQPPQPVNLTTEQKIDLLLEGQKRIEQRLSVLESAQRNMGVAAGAPRAGGGCGSGAAGNMPAIDPNQVYKIDIGRSPIRGNKKAKVTIVEFSEVQCPFSKRFHPIIKEILSAYPKDVNHIFKHFPLNFHPQARPGAKAVLAAGEQGKYFEMLDLLFEKGLVQTAQGQQPEDLEKQTQELYKTLAGELGLNVEKFLKDYKEKDAEWEKIITEDMEVAKTANVRGTPTFYLNGRLLMTRDPVGIKAEIDKILKGEDKPKEEKKDKKGKK